MNYLYNFHSHTNYCDGANKPEEMLLAAIELGLLSYGFSSHAPVPFPNHWCVEKDKLSKYILEIGELKKKYKDRIEVYCGLETDFIHKFSGASLFRNTEGLDYLFGSIHYLYENPWDYLFCVDGPFKEFQKGLKRVFKNDPIAITKRFFELSRKMITTDPPDVVGHIDKIKLNLGKIVPDLEQQDWYLEELDKIVDCLVECKPIVEVNTRGMYKGYISEPYPSVYLLKKLHENKIRISLNSDSHNPDEILKMYQEAIVMLNEIGITESWAMIRGKWMSVKL
ncbi:MAG: histidinol-phosphatase [Bacteroidales bacterium]|nr:histidinol-phosphatase [Bacteroidales bacterium]MCF8455010.1 histidinol-phosphatase [Bacteroidales bacterium]